MPGAADFVQRTVHALETGGATVWIRRALVVLLILTLALIYMLKEFRGLATSQAMDQAQIARNIASGQFWKTDFVRPRAVGQLQDAGKNVATRIWHDTYNAPLPPLVNAFVLWPIKSHWKMTPREIVYSGDKAIAFAAMCFFIASLVPLYFTAKLLFDERLAILATGLVLLSDTIWQYSLSGLPQMLMMLLFNATLYALVRAIQAQNQGGRVGIWLGLVGFGFGLLALSHALTIWIFVAALIFSLFFFRPRGWAAVIVIGMFLLLYTPWLVRNYIICGNPAGLAMYSVLDGIVHAESGHMRRVNLDLEDVGPGHFRAKLITNVIGQANGIFQHLGWSVVAMMFFAALLHIFKRPETSVMRWMVFAMWLRRVSRDGALRNQRGTGRRRQPVAPPVHPDHDLLRARLSARAMEPPRDRRSDRADRLYRAALRSLRDPDDDHDHARRGQRRGALAALRSALHFGLERLDGARGSDRVRHAMGDLLVCGSALALAARYREDLHAVP